MAVKYVPGEGWIFDTPVEAAHFFRLVKGEVPTAKGNVSVPVVQATWTLPPNGRRLLLRLLKHPEGLPGKTLADNLEIQPSELGNVVVGIARWGEGYGLTRREIILKRRARVGGGKSVRTLRLASSFIKKIRSGKIKELKGEN